MDQFYTPWLDALALLVRGQAQWRFAEWSCDPGQSDGQSH
jgi:hypothetical protein